MIGNSMHVAVIQRVLPMVPPPDKLPAPRVNTTSILQALRDQLADKSFKSVPKDGFVIPEIDTTVKPPKYKDMPKPMLGILPDVPKPLPPKANPPPLNSAAPPKEEVEHLSMCEYLNVV